MQTRFPRIAAGIAGIALVQAVPSSAQDTPADHHVSADELSAGVRYFLPQLLQVTQETCRGTLAADGYLAVSGPRLLEKFEDGSEGNWAGARALFISLASEGGAEDDSLDLFSDLPDEALRPLLDSLLPKELEKRFKTRDCPTVERVLETLDPLPADNLADLVGMLLELGMARSRKDEKEASAE